MKTETTPKRKLSLWNRIVFPIFTIRNWAHDTILRSWKGAAIGILAGTVLYLIVLDTFVNTGLGWFVDFTVALLILLLLVPGIGFFVKLLFNLIKKIDSRFAAVAIMSSIVLTILPIPVFGKILVILFGISGALTGFAVSRGWKKPVSLLLFIIIIAANVFAGIQFFNPGFDSTVPVSEKYWNQKSFSVPAADPSLVGQFTVKELTYGSGNDYRRPEFGARASLITKPVDATPFFDQSSGFFNYLRKLYWKFNSKNYPLNARVWYPAESGLFPLVLIVHGNHIMTDFSDPGYEYLGKFLASRGYIAVSIDENYLNSSWIHDYQQEEIFTRGWLLLKHIEQWRSWNGSDGNPFSGKVDMNNIVLIGHSRGGAAVAVAAAINKLKRYFGDANQEFNFNFGIKGIVQIAPNDPYHPQNGVLLKLENINYLVLQGGFDQDVSWFLGNRVYNRIGFNDGDYHFKSALYIYRANHGQFNTVWGRTDFSPPLSHALNLKPIMDPEAQRKIAKLYIAAFADVSTKGKKEFLPIFKDYKNAKSILPKDYYINQFEDSDSKYIADYKEDLDVTTGSGKGVAISGKNLKVWKENALSFRDGDGSSQGSPGVFLGWDRKDTTYKNKTASYSIELGDSVLKTLKIDGSKNLTFFLCNNKEDVNEVDFTIRLISKTDSADIAFSNRWILPPPLKTELTKWPFIFSLNNDKPVERVVQTVEIPVADFRKTNKNFKPEELKEVKFVFDKTDKGEIFLNKIGFN
jgi:dienelactone hydrolase